MISTLADALAERGFDTLTEVQQAVTAPDLAEADLLVSAQTGSGKTVGFGLAIAATLMGPEVRLAPPAAPLALVVAPTRELALQVQRELAWLYAKAGARVVSCIGGMDAREERRALDRGAHIVVGTPGRLRDHITRGNLDLTGIRAIVLDEADEMLDLGFREDLEFMLGAAPEDRRTLLFSATVPPAIADLAKQYQRDAVRVTTLSRGTQHADIAYQAVQVSMADCEHAIINLLRFHDAPRSIVFANTRAAVARLAARLANRGLPVVSLSGELSQDERSHALQAMRDGRARVCVATDVAARGIDLPNLDLVIHADLPTNTEGLLHRSGRTGRAGRKGISALIVPDKFSNKAARLLKWAKIEAEWIFAPTPEEILALDETRLLADPVWTPELTEAEAAFAAGLMAEYGPERIAAACLRLYRARLSAPEELNAPTARAPRTERAPFGPSVWFELSVGHDRRAEARWLLPLLCRAGNLDKTQIGKIRVLPDTTLVEIAESAVPGMLDRLGPQGELEDGIHAVKRDSPPEDTHVPRPAPDRPRPAREDDSAPRPARKPPAQTGAPRAAARPETAPKPPRKPDPKPNSPAPRPPAAPAKAKEKDAPRKPRHPARKKDAVRPNADQRGPAQAGPKGEAGRDATRAGAMDTSKRMDRPDAKKRRAGKSTPNRKGGDAPPRRKR
ncbi:ATP-dependent RNA helicase DeaD [Rhodovulum iodosum]|uniref:ATP-dependent RNA helicase DeaD n=1 Tax=Rhodovulum iodosum TaxID=68291 RepID=A0ABV3XSM1_9RHOB|nr:DEAD/DEAH box helicase [Rhodovulum robiginosum]RSK30643.1 DEAD/DEAH box helicase [Rhodovulum robiginosum]